MEAYAPVAASPQGEPPNDANGPTLAAFERALRHESHNNHRRRPDLTWRQLRNGLQWGEEAVRERLEAERERRTAPGTAPWLLTRTRLRE